VAAVDLTTLRARVREAADMVGSSFVTDTATSLDAFINAAAEELYKLLVAKFVDYFDPVSQALAVAAPNDTYPLAADFLKLRGVDVQEGGVWRSLKPSTMRERNAGGGQTASSLRLMRYRLQGTKLLFVPAPGVSGTARAIYIPQFTKYDSANPGIGKEWWGWEEYIVQVAAAKCAVKEESDPSIYMGEARRIRQQIEEEASSRDASEPGSVGDMDEDGCLEVDWV
jgi:hypothetical protein